jgi:hypothetical protein
VVLNTPGYLRNLTTLLAAEPKRNVANYMLWRAARASIGFMTKEARDIVEEYARYNVLFQRPVFNNTSLPPGVNLAPRGELCLLPSGMFAPSFTPGVNTLYSLEERRGDRGFSSLGDNFIP